MIPSFEMVARIASDKRNSVISMIKKGATVTEITNTVNVSRNAVTRLRAELGLRATRRGGRPREISSTMAGNLCRLVVTGSDANAAAANRRLKADNLASVSRHTITRTYRRNGLKAKRKRKAPPVTRKRRRARLQWARQHEHWTVEQWGKVVFSD